MLGLTPEEDLLIDQLLFITNELKTVDTIGSTKPSITSNPDCSANVTTFQYNEYLEASYAENTLASANLLKTKLKLEEVVRSGLCLTPQEWLQCKDVNMAAFDRALASASTEARLRFEQLGIPLTFVADDEVGRGDQWIGSGGLHYTWVSLIELRFFHRLCIKRTIVDGLQTVHTLTNT